MSIVEKRRRLRDLWKEGEEVQRHAEDQRTSRRSAQLERADKAHQIAKRATVLIWNSGSNHRRRAFPLYSFSRMDIRVGIHRSVALGWTGSLHRHDVRPFYCRSARAGVQEWTIPALNPTTGRYGTNAFKSLRRVHKARSIYQRPVGEVYRQYGHQYAMFRGR